MSSLVIKSLVLREFILEVHREAVHHSFLIEYHLEVELVYLASRIQQVNNFIFIRLLSVSDDGSEIFHSCCVPLRVIHLNRFEVSLLSQVTSHALSGRPLRLRQAALEHSNSHRRVCSQEHR